MPKISDVEILHSDDSPVYCMKALTSCKCFAFSTAFSVVKQTLLSGKCKCPYANILMPLCNHLHLYNMNAK